MLIPTERRLIQVRHQLWTGPHVWGLREDSKLSLPQTTLAPESG